MAFSGKLLFLYELESRIRFINADIYTGNMGDRDWGILAKEQEKCKRAQNSFAFIK